MSNLKKTTVIMTTYNGEKYIIEQMESIRNQTLQPDEVLILDDCSTDSTAMIVENYINEHKLLHWKFVCNSVNQGWKKNFKNGFDMAESEYIFPCDQDDIWLDNKIAVMVRCMEEHPEINVLVSNYELFYSENDAGQNAYERQYKEMLNDGSVGYIPLNEKWTYITRPGCTFCFRKSFYNAIRENWDTRFPHDAVLWNYACMDGSLAILNRKLIRFRRHGNNATSTNNLTRQKRADILKDHLYFYQLALQDQQHCSELVLIDGVNFLKNRILLLEQKKYSVWLVLYLKYSKYYASIKGWLLDLYLALGK